MNSSSGNQPDVGDIQADVHSDTEATALQRAIRHRAIDTIRADQVRPVKSLPQRILVIGFTLTAMLAFVLMINFVVTGMQKIMDVWYPGSISGRDSQAEPVPPLDPTKPFYISVDPLPAQVPDNAATSSASAGTR